MFPTELVAVADRVAHQCFLKGIIIMCEFPFLSYSWVPHMHDFKDDTVFQIYTQKGNHANNMQHKTVRLTAVTRFSMKPLICIVWYIKFIALQYMTLHEYLKAFKLFAAVKK